MTSTSGTPSSRSACSVGSPPSSASASSSASLRIVTCRRTSGSKSASSSSGPVRAGRTSPCPSSDTRRPRASSAIVSAGKSDRASAPACTQRAPASALHVLGRPRVADLEHRPSRGGRPRSGTSTWRSIRPVARAPEGRARRARRRTASGRRRRTSRPRAPARRGLSARALPSTAAPPGRGGCPSTRSRERFPTTAIPGTRRDYRPGERGPGGTRSRSSGARR